MKRIVTGLMVLGLFVAATAHGEEGVLDRAGKAVKKGGEATGKAVAKGGEATVKGLKTAGGWLGEKMEQGGEKIKKATK